MSTRLAQGGRLIDRSKRVSFSWNGAKLNGYQGDTLASALLANGKTLVGRSFKYHRPRGIVGRSTRVCLGSFRQVFITRPSFILVRLGNICLSR